MKSTTKKLSELKGLSSRLLATLDEVVFFSELGKYFSKIFPIDQVSVYLVREKSVCLLPKKNKKGVSAKEIGMEKTEGWPVGHVVRTRRPYFCNDVARDPLLGQMRVQEGIFSELAMPIIHDGEVMATIHLQCKTSKHKFDREDVARAGHILSQLEIPLANIKKYLNIKNLHHSLLKQVEKYQEQNRIQSPNSDADASDPSGLNKDKKIICKSQAVKKVLRTADKVAATDATCLLVGERGVGKEMMARHIHYLSSRAHRPFIVVDCSALEEKALSAKIFGEKPANKKTLASPGLLEMAKGGTLLLNHVEYLGRALQSEINACMSQRRFDVRMMAASNVDLKTLMEQGNFCEKLLFALSTMILRVPSLRERLEDVAILATHFLNEDRGAGEQKSLSPSAIALLRKYHWPGNVRELQSVIKRAYILSDGIIVEKGHIVGVHLEEGNQEEPFREQTLDEVIKGHIQATLEYLGGNKTKTAKVLGITVKTLYNKLRNC